LIAHRANLLEANRLAAEDQRDPELARLDRILKGQMRQLAVSTAA